jgi:hypothetical protein
VIYLLRRPSFDILKTNIVLLITKRKLFFTFFSFLPMNNNLLEEVIPLILQFERREEREL